MKYILCSQWFKNVNNPIRNQKQKHQQEHNDKISIQLIILNCLWNVNPIFRSGLTPVTSSAVLPVKYWNVKKKVRKVNNSTATMGTYTSTPIFISLSVTLCHHLANFRHTNTNLLITTLGWVSKLRLVSLHEDIFDWVQLWNMCADISSFFYQKILSFIVMIFGFFIRFWGWRNIT